jgi:hypothetical protein
MFLGDLLLKLIEGLWRGFWRAVNVKRTAPQEEHTPTDYADAFLFRDEDRDTPDSSSPPSILPR